MIMFIDREDELKKLFEIANSKKAELVLLYGRRRVGKSRLLIEFVNRTKALYLLADLSKNMLEIMAKQTNEEFVKFGTWEDFFEYIYKSKHKIVVIDEFQYLCHLDKAWPSMLQRWWEKIKETDKKIVLCGSIISTIYKITKGHRAALYGRKTCEMQITPLKFKFLKEFFPNYGFEDIVKVYATVGGVPRYLEEFDKKLSVEENIRHKILNKTSFLYNEPFNLLFEEFRDPTPYVSIITAIAQGHVKFFEIAEASMVESNTLPKYLLVLEMVGLIDKTIPVTEKRIRTKTTSYLVKDNFYKFWFTFVFKNKSSIEQGLEKEVFKIVMKGFNAYVGNCFEDVCKQVLINTKVFKFTKIGRWWHKDKEIDIVALNEETKQILFAECKWQENVDAEKVLEELKEKSQHVKWRNNERKENYAIFAKGFKRKIKKSNTMLIDANELSKWQ